MTPVSLPQRMAIDQPAFSASGTNTPRRADRMGYASFPFGGPLAAPLGRSPRPARAWRGFRALGSTHQKGWPCGDIQGTTGFIERRFLGQAAIGSAISLGGAGCQGTDASG